jgi:hypothetical protein
MQLIDKIFRVLIENELQCIGNAFYQILLAYGRHEAFRVKRRELSLIVASNREQSFVGTALRRHCHSIQNALAFYQMVP